MNVEEKYFLADTIDSLTVFRGVAQRSERLEIIELDDDQ